MKIKTLNVEDSSEDGRSTRREGDLSQIFFDESPVLYESEAFSNATIWIIQMKRLILMIH